MHSIPQPSVTVIEEDYGAPQSGDLCSVVVDGEFVTPRWLSGGTSRNYCARFLEFVRDRKVMNVLKCSLAYFIGSLAVYAPAISNLYGKSDSKHMIATVAVYFHPARTMGNMYEAVTFVIISLAYSLIVAILSMIVSAKFMDWDLKYGGYVIDLMVFCAGGLGLIAFMKQKVNKPTFNTACSLASIFLITILTKEGQIQAGYFSLSKLLQSFMFVWSGVLISVVLCFCLWPQSALSELQKSLNKSMNIESVMLGYISEMFLAGSDIETSQFDELNKELKGYFKEIDTNLTDTKYELYAKGYEKEYHILERLIESNRKLIWHLGGLSSGAKIQWHLLCQGDSTTGDTSSHSTNGHGDNSSIVSFGEIVSRISREPTPIPSTQEDPMSPTNLFKLFVEFLEPPLRSYCYTIKEILLGLPFDNNGLVFSSQIIRRLSLATDLYSEARERALQALYSQDVFKGKRDFDAMADEEGIAASCGNFSYVMEAFGNELKIFLEILEGYQHYLDSESRKRTFVWLQFWKNAKDPRRNSITEIDSQQSISSPGSINSPVGLKVWRSLRLFRRKDIQFGIKVGIGAALFAIPAFNDQLRPVFSLWRGEWGLITYAIIMNKSVGGTAMTVPIRFLGTFLGAAIAFTSWTLFPENQYVLAFIGWALSLPCFWIIVNWKTRNPFGRFILLTFNLTALYSYSISMSDNEDDDDEGGIHPIVRDIAFHRFVSVFIGVLWALIIASLIMPNPARRRLKDVLCVQWLRMGFIWKNDPLSVIEDRTKLIKGIRGGSELTNTMIELQTLLSQAPMELRLKGRFPEYDYKAMLTSTQQILDAFQNMQVLTSKYHALTSKELDLLIYTESERKELSSRIFLFFYLVCSALKLGFPLPDRLPSTEHAIDRMLAKLSEYRSMGSDQDQGKKRTETLTEEDFVLFYSYVLVTLTITEELAKIALSIQRLFGVIEGEKLEVL